MLSSFDHFLLVPGDLDFFFLDLLEVPGELGFNIPVEDDCCTIPSTTDVLGVVSKSAGTLRLPACPTTIGLGSFSLMLILLLEMFVSWRVHCPVGCTDVLPASCLCPGTTSCELVEAGGVTVFLELDFVIS